MFCIKIHNYLPDPALHVDVPSYQGGIDRTFRQHPNRHRLKGYDGMEKYIDMNVFRGKADELRKYGECSG
jgi:hypothetical protein